MSRVNKNLLVGTLVFSILTAWAVTDASATDDVVICIEYETNFTDWEMGDYYASSPPVEYNAIRPQVRVYDNDSQTVIFNDNTNSPNCTPLLGLNSNHDFQIKVYAGALLDDNNEIRVYDNSASPVWHSQVVAASWDPSGSGVSTFVYQYNGTYKVSNVLAAAGWAVNRRPAGLSNLDINYFTDPCPEYDGNCLGIDDEVHRIFIGPGSVYKSTIAHETGHEILYQKNGNDGWVSDCSFQGTGNCGHPLGCAPCHCDTCLEYQSCAAIEGFADFFGVAAWNNQNESDCDYNAAGESCEDWGNWISYGSCCDICTGKGTEWDWVHFWWDIYTDGGGPMADIAQIYNLSDPEDWSDPDDVYPTLRSEGIGFGIPTVTWNILAASNGIDH